MANPSDWRYLSEDSIKLPLKLTSSEKSESANTKYQIVDQVIDLVKEL